MAFDDSTGGIDRARHHSHEPIWGDDWGDRHIARLLDAARIAPERAEVDRLAHEKYLERRARIAADATRRRSAPVEELIERERAKKERGSFGAVLAQALSKAHQRDKKR